VVISCNNALWPPDMIGGLSMVISCNNALWPPDVIGGLSIVRVNVPTV
jgi:hypothetical protein